MAFERLRVGRGIAKQEDLCGVRFLRAGHPKRMHIDFLRSFKGRAFGAIARTEATEALADGSTLP